MTSSSPEVARPRLAGAVLVGADADAATPLVLADRELRSGSWTRHGGTAVLGDAVTEHALSGLVERAGAAARAQGYATGWAEGRRAAQEEAQRTTAELLAHAEAEQARRDAEHRGAVDALARAAVRLEAAVAQVAARLEAHVTEVAVALTETLLGHELAVAESPGVDAVRRALALAPGEPVVRVRVCPEDAAASGLAAITAGAVVVADPALRRGDAVVETTESVLDATVSGAMARVREVLQP